jgi:diguanylate cyclase (GGDEF)-like protein
MWKPGRVERWYFAVRLFAYVLFVLLALYGAMGMLGDRGPALVASAAVFTMTNIGILVLRYDSRTPFAEALLWVAPFDLIWLGMMSYGLHGFEDPVLPALLAMPILYAFLLRSRSAAYIAFGAAGVYLASHFFGTPDHTTAAFAFVVLKSATILFIGTVASVWAATYEAREREIEDERADKAELTEELQRRLTELQAVSQISEIIHSSLDFDRVGQLVLDILVKVLNIPACALFVIDKQKAQTLFTASVGISGAGKPLQPRSLEAVEDLYVADTHFSCQSVLDHPMMMVVFCAPADTWESLSAEDRLVLQAVASELVVAVENSRLYKLTRRLAITDELTGLHNYRFLQQRLDEEIERAKRYGKDLSLLMIDVDDFKSFNDTFGHLAGDAALAELARVMRLTVREVDLVARYGGEEFSVVLPETDAAGAFVVAEKLREAVAAHEFEEGTGGAAPHITVSLGLATYPTHAHDKESLLRQADDALYRSKSTGKNRVRSPLSGREHADAAAEPREDLGI